MEAITFSTTDGLTLTGTRFLPSARAQAVVVLPAAMGVKQDFYGPFAQFRATLWQQALAWLEQRTMVDNSARTAVHKIA